MHVNVKVMPSVMTVFLGANETMGPSVSEGRKEKKKNRKCFI